MDGSEAAGSGSGNGNFSAAGVQSQPIKSAPMSSSRQQNSASDFSPYFLAAAAAASAQAEAAAAAAGSSSSSTSASVQPPAPYTHTNSPFPVTIASRMTQPAVCAAVSTQSRESGSSCRRRCSWAIISTRSIDLPFLYIDAADKQSFASSSIQSASFFDYVHPEEVARVGHDMRNIIDSHTLFGSVARCRYASPSLRKHGAAKRRTKEGDEYLAVDIVVNWIGDDMALCFFHAIIDESAQDNDEYNKSDWSNWCGMLPGSFDQAERQTLWQSILKHRSLQPSSSGAQSVFQILSAPSQAEEPPQPTQPQILFSWPPPRLNSLSAAHYTDGSYYVHDFARLAQGVEHLTLQKEAGDANTSCTRRFRAKHTLTTEGMIRGVESVLIPYGSILLACFQVSYVQILPAAPASSDVKPTSTPSFRSLVDASVSAAQQEGRVQGIVGQVDEVRQSEDPSDTSVATLAAVAAAAAAQSKSCVSCGSRSSPEWRKGPDGTKCLCNACGLRFSRNVSKAKRRDERAQIAAQVAANGGIIPPHLRQKLSEQRKKSYKKVKAVDKEEGKAKVAEYGQETAQESSLAIEPAPIVPPDGQEVGQSSTK